MKFDIAFGVFGALAVLSWYLIVDDQRRDAVRDADKYAVTVADNCLAGGGECFDVCEEAHFQFTGEPRLYARVVETCRSRLTERQAVGAKEAKFD